MADFEILAHVSAPSRGLDDARYRALANAYLQFVPATRQVLGDNGKSNEMLTNEADNQLFGESGHNTQAEQASWESYQPEDHEEDEFEDESTSISLLGISQSQRALLESIPSPQLSFSSAADNADSPTFRSHVEPRLHTTRRAANDYYSQKSTDSWRPASSIIVDSQPEVDRGLNVHSSPTRILELYLQQIDSSDAGSQELKSRRRNHTSDPHSVPKIISQDVYGSSSDNALQPSLPLLNTSFEARALSPILGNPTSEITTPFGPASRISSDNNTIGDIRSSSQNSEIAIPLTLTPSMFDSSLLSKKITSRGRIVFGSRATIRDTPVPSDIPLDTCKEYLEKLTSRHDSKTSSSSNLSADQVMLPPAQNMKRRLESSRTGNDTLPGRMPKTSTPLIEVSPALQKAGCKEQFAYPTQDSGITLKRRQPGTMSIAGMSPSSSPSKPKHTHTIPESAKRPEKRQRIENTHAISSSWPVSLKSGTEQVEGTIIPTPENTQQPKRMLSDENPNSTSVPSSLMDEAPKSTKIQLASWANQKDIHPPPPPTSSNDLTPDMFITPNLHHLANNMPAGKLYKPSYQERDLEPWDRGYWLVDCTSWSKDLRIRNWNVLGNFVGKSLASWTVWCERSEDFSSLKVFCYGVAVKYVYLLLFMASECKIKKVNARWLDAKGNSVIRM